MTLAEDDKMDPAVVAALYLEHSIELRNFLIGVLRDPEAAGDVMQIAFAKVVEAGHTAKEETLKGWLFRTAFHEALALRRRRIVEGKAVRKVAGSQNTPRDFPGDRLLRWEAVGSVREALVRLPAEQQQVVRMRIYEEKTFATIAAELDVPLGTVLTRMRSALGKLRAALQPGHDET